MNPLIKLIKESASVPIPQSTHTDKTYWFTNNGSIYESENSIIINASDPTNKNPIGGIAYIIHNDFMGADNVNRISSQFMQHPHVISIHEWHAAMNEDGGVIDWEKCLTPVKVLGNIQKGYN